MLPKQDPRGFHEPVTSRTLHDGSDFIDRSTSYRTRMTVSQVTVSFRIDFAAPLYRMAITPAIIRAGFLGLPLVPTERFKSAVANSRVAFGEE